MCAARVERARRPSTPPPPTAAPPPRSPPRSHRALLGRRVVLDHALDAEQVGRHHQLLAGVDHVHEVHLVALCVFGVGCVVGVVVCVACTRTSVFAAAAPPPPQARRASSTTRQAAAARRPPTGFVQVCERPVEDHVGRLVRVERRRGGRERRVGNTVRIGECLRRASKSPAGARQRNDTQIRRSHRCRVYRDDQRAAVEPSAHGFVFRASEDEVLCRRAPGALCLSVLRWIVIVRLRDSMFECQIFSLYANARRWRVARRGKRGEAAKKRVPGHGLSFSAILTVLLSPSRECAPRTPILSQITSLPLFMCACVGRAAAPVAWRNLWFRFCVRRRSRFCRSSLSLAAILGS